MFRPAAVLALLLASGVAFANQERAPLSINDHDFAEQRRQIEAGLADGKTYAEISPLDRRTVQELLARIGGRLERAESFDQLTAEEKTRVFNEQETVNQILTQAAADSRLVCRHEAATGTRFKKTRCYTVAERRRRMEQDQDDLRRAQNGFGPGGT